MQITERTLEGLDSFLKEHLEADIVARVADSLGIPSAQAMRVYYTSPIAPIVEAGEYGAQYLDASYLADEVIKSASAAASLRD